MLNIPKKIHYCWFGKNEKNDEVKRLVSQWKEKCPDYEIIEWNEDNFDVNSNQYVKEAYENKKWAFVSDYVRLYALSKFGGIYLDTDVELVKNLDFLLNLNCVLGYEDKKMLSTCFMACRSNNDLISSFLKEYENIHFIKENGEFDFTPNVSRLSKLVKESYKVELNGTYFSNEKLVIYPKDYFCPKNYETNKINLTENTVAIHHFSGSWLSEEMKKANELKGKYGKIGYGIWLLFHSPNELMKSLKRKINKK